ncbi:hypothetical protein [Natrinema sp. H-ect4]|uniref:hypothetical protein n=1 Tax=Natrinema sp. H-ect4 TaxID=3242699 RepID=UPI0035A84287
MAELTAFPVSSVVAFADLVVGRERHDSGIVRPDRSRATPAAIQWVRSSRSDREIAIYALEKL